MIGIKDIGIYVPETFVDNLKRCGEYQTDRDFITKKLGFQKLPKMEEGLETSDLCVLSFKDLLAHNNALDKSQIDCIVVCTQTPDGRGLPHTSAIVQQKLGLSKNVACFDISLGCSGYVYGLSIIISFMRANKLANGLFFTADPYSKIVSSSDRDTELLFGDAATCTLLCKKPIYNLLESVFATDGSGIKAIMVDPSTQQLSMKGKDVFMFAMKQVPPQIDQCLEANSLAVEDIGLFIFHQGSKYIVDNLRKRLSINETKAPFKAYETGNTVSSSIPLLLKEALPLGHNYVLLSGFGVGLSWATTILKKVPVNQQKNE